MTASVMSAGDGYLYYTRSIATGDAQRTPGTPLTDYYTVDGNPPGVWMGAGTSLLGVSGEVTEAQMKALYGEGLHPDADAITADMQAAGALPAEIKEAISLGRAYYQYDAKHPELRQAIDKATTEFHRLHGRKPDKVERHQLQMREGAIAFRERHGRPHLDSEELSKYVSSAMKADQHAVAFIDLTFSVPKTVSVLWAIGDRDLSARIEAAHERAIAHTLRWIEKEAVATRAGTNGVRQIDVKGGVVATRFRHYESRNGDPHLHDHLNISNKVQGTDGKWRALDSRLLLRLKVAASTEFDKQLMIELDREGIGSETRTLVDGKTPRLEVAGIDQRLIDTFSTRRDEIHKATQPLVDGYIAEHGRAPSQDARIKLSAQAWQDTRPKKDTVRSVSAIRAEARSRAIAATSPAYVNAVGNTVLTATRRARNVAHDLAPIDVRTATAEIMRNVEAARGTWGYNHVKAEIDRYTDAHAYRRYTLTDNGVTQELSREHAETFFLHAALTHGSIPVTPEHVHGRFQPLIRASDDGSVYVSKARTLYTSIRVLEAESRLLEAARTTSPTPAAVDADTFAQALRDQPNSDYAQVRLAREFVTNRTRLVVGVGPAGAGKTRSMKLAAHAVKLAGGRMIGLAPSKPAADVFQRDVGVPAFTIDAFLTAHRIAAAEGTPVPAQYQVNARDVVVIDEAAMATTTHLDEVTIIVDTADGYTRPLGDDGQNAAVGGGGAFRLIRREVGAVELETVYRFTNPEEAAASLLLRESAPSIDPFAWYKDNNRVIAATQDRIGEVLFTDYVADLAAGDASVMMAPTNAHVDELNGRAQALAMLEGHLVPGATTTLRDGNDAYVGERIMTRLNTPKLRTDDGAHTVTNGDVYTVNQVHPDGSITASHATLGSTIHLPYDYLSEHAHLGYAYTVNQKQGDTIGGKNDFDLQIDGHARGIVNGTTARANAYVLATRGTTSNTFYVEIEPGQNPDDVLAKIASNADTNLAAHEMIDVESDRVTDLSRLIDEYNDITNQANAKRFEALATRALDDTHARTLTGSAGWEAAAAGLARAEKLGLDPAHVLTETWNQREFKTADDVGAVMSYRIEGHLKRIVDEGTLEPLPELGAATGRYEWAVDRTALAHPDVPEEWRAELGDRNSYIDDRMVQRGVDLTLEQPEWTKQLGPVPERMDKRVEWMELAAEIDLFRTRYNIPEDNPTAIPESFRDHETGKNLADRVTDLHKATTIRKVKGTHRDADPAEQLAAAQKIGRRVDARRPVADAEKAAAALNPGRSASLPKHLADLPALISKNAQAASQAAERARTKSAGNTKDVDLITGFQTADEPTPTVQQRGPRL
ncbi:MobF family relaxase [Microbacterium sp. NPDC055665]